jgi:hypothetical protein
MDVIDLAVHQTHMVANIVWLMRLDDLVDPRRNDETSALSIETKKRAKKSAITTLNHRRIEDACGTFSS